MPYLWQKKTKKDEKDKTVRLPAPSYTERINLLGFLSRQNCLHKSYLHSFCHSGRLTAQFLVDSVHALLPALTNPTIRVFNVTSVHRAKLVKAKREQWRRKGLRLLLLPQYCLHLNLIESQRHIKHR